MYICVTKPNKMITTSTSIEIGLKFQVKGNNLTKLICNKNRYIDITLSNDMYNVRAYNMRGINEVKVVEINQVFADQLQETIIKAFKN